MTQKTVSTKAKQFLKEHWLGLIMLFLLILLIYYLFFVPICAGPTGGC